MFTLQVDGQKPMTGVLDIAPPVLDITAIKRSGHIATMKVDWQNPKWNFTPRRPGDLYAWPQTFTFNTRPVEGKGERIPLTTNINNFGVDINGQTNWDKVLQPSAGWINSPTEPPTIESLSWAANPVIVLEHTLHLGADYSRVFALDCNAPAYQLTGNPTKQDWRLVLHKYNAVTADSKLIKFGAGFDIWTPFIASGDMWCKSEYLEFWPELPHTLADGRIVIEYILTGYTISGRLDDNSVITLRSTTGFPTSWHLDSPEVPI